jgi:hypothetical protein
LNSRVRYDDVTDGASHTVFLGEKLPDGWDLHWLSGTRATLRNMGAPINWMSYKAGLPMPGGTMATPLVLPPLDAIPGLDDVESDPDAAATEAAGAAAATPAAAKIGPGNPLWVGGFGSAHPNGAMFAIGDGSVKYLVNSMSTVVLQQYAHRSDGKLPPRYW